jgi:hypothetical protein
MAEPATMEEIFGNVIYAYTRADAIEDGELVEVSELYPEDTRVYKYPVAFTRALWATVEEGATEGGDTIGGRVWDVCYMGTAATAKREGPDSHYPVIIGGKTHHLRANCGPGDTAEPVITIGFPEDF